MGRVDIASGTYRPFAFNFDEGIIVTSITTSREISENNAIYDLFFATNLFSTFSRAPHVHFTAF